MARTINERNSADSDIVPNVTSREAPIPSKLLPVSIAARTVNMRPRAKRYATRITSPGNPSGDSDDKTGINVAAVSIAARFTIGPARKTHVVVLLYTTPLRMSL